jgi:hypothetical protein
VREDEMRRLMDEIARSIVEPPRDAQYYLRQSAHAIYGLASLTMLILVTIIIIAATN